MAGEEKEGIVMTRACGSGELACSTSDGKHTTEMLRVITRYEVGGLPGSEEVIRWCRCCGAITVDQEIDRRLYKPSMKWPTYELRQEDTCVLPLLRKRETPRSAPV